MVPGTLRSCSVALAGVGGVVEAKETADFYLHTRLDQGGRRRVRLRDQLVLPDCPHHLLSVGAEARRGIIVECLLRHKTEWHGCCSQMERQRACST
eukprot:scaffold913_cov138-Isochrysis_galbana.AAC.1